MSKNNLKCNAPKYVGINKYTIPDTKNSDERYYLCFKSESLTKRFITFVNASLSSNKMLYYNWEVTQSGTLECLGIIQESVGEYSSRY